MHSVFTVRLSFAAAVLALFPFAGDARQSPGKPPDDSPRVERPFGTLREQAAMQQDWLRKRLDTFLPPLMRKHGIDLWVVPMREYTEDPVFTAITAPTTFAARRRTIYVFFDSCAARSTPPTASCVQRIALGGTSQDGVFEARRSTRTAAADVGRGQQAELWGDEQWQVLKAVIEERNPRVIGINRSTVFAFSDGLTSGELKGMTQALGDRWTSRFRDAEGLPLELIASRLPEEEEFFRRMQELVWSLTQSMFSSKLITVGKTRPSDLVWWWRQRVNDWPTCCSRTKPTRPRACAAPSPTPTPCRTSSWARSGRGAPGMKSWRRRARKCRPRRSTGRSIHIRSAFTATARVR
jgi:hypothetical protein